MKIKKYRYTNEDRYLFKILTEDFQLNQQIRDLYKDKDFIAEFINQPLYNSYIILTTSQNPSERLIRLKNKVTEILDKYRTNPQRKPTFNQLAFYIFNVYSELEQSPFKLKKRYLREIVLFLLHRLVQLRSTKPLTEKVKNELENDIDKFKALFPRKYQTIILQKALKLCIQVGFTAALSFLKLVEQKPQVYENVSLTPPARKRGRVWIELSYYDEVDDVRQLLSGEYWKKYKKMLSAKQGYTDTEIKRKGETIMLSLPSNLKTVSEIRNALSNVWIEISLLQKEIILNQKYKYKMLRQIKDFPVTYRTALLDTRKYTPGKISKSIYGEHNSVPIIRHILKKKV